MPTTRARPKAASNVPSARVDGTVEKHDSDIHELHWWVWPGFVQNRICYAQLQRQRERRRLGVPDFKAHDNIDTMQSTCMCVVGLWVDWYVARCVGGWVLQHDQTGKTRRSKGLLLER